MGMLLLVRHGQASFGAADYDVLSETGWAQARLLGRWLAEQGVEPTAVVRGGMRRHRETAEAMVEAAGWSGTETAVEPGWDEFDHVGLMRGVPTLPPGHTRRDFQAAFEQATAAWARADDEGSGTAADDQAESYAGFVARVRASLAGATAAAGSGETVVVVTSGGPIGVACASLVAPGADRETLAGTWAAFNTVVVNSSVTRLVVGAGGTRMLTFNEHPHLTPETLTYR